MSESIHLSNREQLFQAAELNNQKDVEFLVNEKKVHVDITDYNGRTPAHIAAMYGHVNIVKFVLNKDPSILEAKDKSEETVLMKAITYGHLNVVKHLVEDWKLSISQRYSRRHFGNTAIHFATRYGQLEILKYFIEERKGNVNIENDFRETPLFLAAENKLYRIIQYLVEERKADATKIDSKGYNILYKAVDNDDLGFIKYLLDLRQIAFDLNWRGFAGDTLVHHAVQLNRENVLLYLVNEKRADVNIADEEGETPLHKAAARNNYRVCRFLIEHGADIGTANEKGQLPVHLAKNERLIRFLQDHQEHVSELRSRRSASETIVSHHLAASPLKRITADLSGYLPTADQPTTASSADVRTYFQFQSFLAIADAVTGIGRIENHFFPSPREIIVNKMDPLAINAVRSVPHFQNHRSQSNSYSLMKILNT